ncbi:hypothetical protein UB46_38210 [Burkholderiaceae bacterium 16]|nr:hypothetical protein UB46_38210 [Burkholderiaceae bacterium 16]
MRPIAGGELAAPTNCNSANQSRDDLQEVPVCEADVIQKCSIQSQEEALILQTRLELVPMGYTIPKRNAAISDCEVKEC